MEPQLLEHGAKVKGTNYTYTIDKVLGKGSYGITYLATTHITLNGDLGNIDAEAQVTLKEFYMPSRMHRTGDTVERDFADKEIDSFARCFYIEADTISSLSHPNIVKVLEVFVANNTCYYAMEYLNGGSLNEYIEKNKYVKEGEAIMYTRQIGSALSYMHSHNMIHLDVKPKNMVFASDGTLKLIDYGLSHRYDADGDMELTDGLGGGTPGYAPIEQADIKSANTFTPLFDIYALGASYYKMLTGEKPQSAIEIKENGLILSSLPSKHVSQQSIDAIKAAMQPDPKDRPQSIEAFLAMLPDTPIEKTQEKKKSFNFTTKITAVAILIILILISVLLYFFHY